MRWSVLAALLALAACTDKDEPGACDATPVAICFPSECDGVGVCVRYNTESGFSSCNDYDACIATTLSCSPGMCTPECAAALCAAPYTCDPTAISYFVCVKP
jgi:hypothetical protein